MEPPTILFTMPMKMGDPTQHTYMWARQAVQMSRSLGYKDIILEKERTTYNNVSNIIRDKKNNIRAVVHFGHGCINSIQGQKECMITKKYTVEETVEMALSGDIEKVHIARALLDPLYYLSDDIDKSSCQLNDPCDLYCLHDSNVKLLNGKLVYTVACFSAGGLGKDAIDAGADTYIGSDDLFLFPVDSLQTQDIYGKLQLVSFKELLLGHTVAEAEAKMSEEEDKLIRRFKSIKYIALTLLFNKLHRKVLGDPNTMI